MSTSFTLPEDKFQEQCIALRFFSGGQCVRFAFPEFLFSRLKDIKLVGDDGSIETVNTLFDKADQVDFLAQDVTPQDHISHGSIARRERWENR